MKAIKDCEWEVSLNISIGCWFWSAKVNDSKTGVFCIDFESRKGYSRKEQVKRNWEKFAKLNKIKRWRYI